MSAIQIALALQILTPGADYAVHGYPDGTYKVVWSDKNVKQPTDAEIEAASASYVAPLTINQQVVALQAQVAALQKALEGSL